MFRKYNRSTVFLAACIYFTTVALQDSKQVPIVVTSFLFSNGKNCEEARSIRVTSTGTTGSTGIGAGPKGFRKSETLEQLLQKYPNRIPDRADNDQPCPCGVEGKSYADCCYPYHMKVKLPESPKRVLQSRYSAFVYRLIGYIIDTTHPSCRDYRNDKISWAKSMNKNGMFDSFIFVGLNITQYDDDESAVRKNISEAHIEFQVALRASKATPRQAGFVLSDARELRINERSKFIKDHSTGVWLYASGVVRSTDTGDNFILNP